MGVSRHYERFPKSRFTSRVIDALNGTASNKKIAILGFAFKKDTNDTRESAAIDVCKQLLSEQAHIAIFDPQVEASDIYKDLEVESNDPRITIASDPYQATEATYAALILTEWDSFKDLDFEKIYKHMQKPAHIFDGRNILDLHALQTLGFSTHGIGKGGPTT